MPELFHVLTLQLVPQVKVSPNKFQYSMLVPLFYVKLHFGRVQKKSMEFSILSKTHPPHSPSISKSQKVKKVGSINANLGQSVERYSEHNNVIKEYLVSLNEEVKAVQKDNLRKAEEIIQNIQEGVNMTCNHSDIILKQIKVFKDEVFNLEEENLRKIEYIGLQLLGIQVRINFKNIYK